MISTKMTYHNLKKKGLCVSCGHVPPVLNYTRCRTCRFNYKKQRMKRTEECKRLELCIRCLEKHKDHCRNSINRNNNKNINKNINNSNINKGKVNVDL